MKRLARLVLFLTVIGLLSALLIHNLKPHLEVVDLLPTDTLALLEWNNFSRSWERWQHSSLAGKLKDPDFPRILEQMGVPGNQLAEFKTMTAFLDQFTQTSFFTGLLRETSVLALLPGPQGQPLHPADLLNQLVLIVPSGAEFSPHQQLERFFGTVRSTGSSVYQGVPLVILTFESGQIVTLCQYRGQLLFALDPKPVQRCIDQALHQMVQAHSGLQAHPEYQRLRQRVTGQSDFFLYADLAVLLKQLAGVRIEENPEPIPHHLALFHLAQAEHDRLGIVAQVAPPQLTAFTTQYRLASPTADPFGPQVSTETQMYLWTNWFTPKILWNLGLRMRDHEIGALMLLFAQSLIEGTGKSTDDFFDVFGSRFGVFIAEQQGPYRSSRSMACLSVEVRDQQEVDRMLKQLLAGQQVVTVVTGELEINSVIMAGGLLQPSYALVDKHLILADTAELIAQVQGQGGLAPAVDPEIPVPAIEQTGNFFLFVRTGTLADQLIAMLTVLAKETSDPARRLPQQSRLLIEHVLIPLLTSLQSTATSRLRGYAAGDEMILEMDFVSAGE